MIIVYMLNLFGFPHRRKLMETNSQSLELSLEQSRHLMVVRDWEGERVVKKKLNPLADHSIDNKV